jgi:hypothetical protein
MAPASEYRQRTLSMEVQPSRSRAPSSAGPAGLVNGTADHGRQEPAVESTGNRRLTLLETLRAERLKLEQERARHH